MKNIIPYIVYDDRKWLMNLTSGFERFSLNVWPIRIALINISNLPKMSGIIIDEVTLGVMDSENLSKLPVLFSYLKLTFIYTDSESCYRIM